MPSPEHASAVPVHVARSAMEAQVLRAVLEDAGIPAFVDEDQRSDEFAVSQKLLNLVATRVLVPPDRLEEARAVLAEARTAVDEAELDAQALAAAQAEPVTGQAPVAAGASVTLRPSGAWFWTAFALVAACVAVLFTLVWLVLL